ncbi:hypothetical protein M0805_002717 [Coniferiporia weirii]|nr:hypothetical protein M0805_002717 [Coniferiporia weirii]
MSCTPTPTSTQFGTVVSTSVSTGSSTQITTLPDTTSTSLITSCLASASGSSGGSSGECASSTVITSTSVIPGVVSTAQVPFEVTTLVTSTEATNTLFSSCTDTTTTTSSTTTTTSSTTSDTTTTSTTETTSTSSTTTDTTSSTTGLTQSVITTLTTPTTTFTTSVNTTLADGFVTQGFLTITSTLPASSVVQTTLVPQGTTQPDTNTGGGASSNVGAIVGGAVGGFVGLIGIVAALWFFCRRRTNWDDIFEKDYDEYADHVRRSRSHLLDMEDEPVGRGPDASTEPKPYVYGLVGSAQALSPPSLDAGLPRVPKTPPLAGYDHPSSETPLMSHSAVPSAASSRPNSFNAVPLSVGHGSSPHAGVSPSPSVAVSATSRRSGSPGPLGVLINTGPSLSMSQPTGADSPTSITTPRRALFVANQDPMSRPGSPGSPGSPGMKKDNVGDVAGPSSFTRAMTGLSDAHDSASSHSVYSQASTPVRGQSQRRTSGGVIVHVDGGRVPSQNQPPSYLD